jgi:HK97 family phage prohead protease
MQYCYWHWRVTDSGGDVVLPGAFAGAGKRVPLLWQHDTKEPIGFVKSMREDGRGLRVVARVVASGRGEQAVKLLRAGAIDGLSFGYRVKPGEGVASRSDARPALIGEPRPDRGVAGDLPDAAAGSDSWIFNGGRGDDEWRSIASAS